MTHLIPPPQRRTKRGIVAILVALIIIIGLTAQSFSGKGDEIETQTGPTTTSAPPGIHTLTLAVDTSTGVPATVTTHIPPNGPAQQYAAMPWEATIRGLHDISEMSGLTLTAQKHEIEGVIGCRILWDGEEITGAISPDEHDGVSCHIPENH